MTGAEHYQRAEELLALPEPSTAEQRAAIAHATLAHAAAAALPTVVHFLGDSREVTAWGRLLRHEQVVVPS